MKDLKIHYSPEFQNVLASTGSALVISVYQAGKLILLNATDEGSIKITPISYPKPMGIDIDGDRMSIATKTELHIYAQSDRLSERIELNGKKFEKVFFPRTTYHTGPLDMHDVRFIGDEVWGVNTRFSCICSFDHQYNFTPRWQPHFIKSITPEDKCHLNGMAVENGEPLYITALGSNDRTQGWRENITNGGILMSIPDNEILIDGLAMPHSPKIVGDYIYLLESARGALVRIDRRNYKVETVTRLQGLVRGLTIINNTAFIGISKVREKSTTFSRLDDSVKAEHCSITAVDLSSGMILGFLEFQNIIEEIYDIDCFQGNTSIGIVGTYDERQNNAITTPDEAYWKKPKPKEAVDNPDS
ncbi:MAG: TIGR03032 family protein [Bacteroidia bacterium]